MAEDKLQFIQEYIDLANRIYIDKDFKKAEHFQDIIIGVFASEILDIAAGLDSYAINPRGAPEDILADLHMLRQKLRNYAANIKRADDKIAAELELARASAITVSANAQSNPTQKTSLAVQMYVTIDQTISQINDIPDENLPSADKAALKDYVYALEGIRASKDNTKFWEKAKSLLKFLADKGADAAIATLPIIINGLQAM